MHLTVGVNVYRWADLLHEALAAAAQDDERFRASLPPGVLLGTNPVAALADRFRELLGPFARAVRPDHPVRALADQFFGQLPVLPNAHFVPPPAAAGIDLDTVLEKSPATLCRVVQDGNWVVIEFPGGQVGGPLKIASALRFVAAARRFPVRALPDDLGGDAKLVLVRRLIRERLLVVAPPDGGANGSSSDAPRPSAVGP
ncbi:MAG: hypothetical protein JWO38_2675 [Gemmataceae bacterium]|nr:hypothetical protein [Gemmataceae bacterium]